MKGWRTNLWADWSTGNGLSRRRGADDSGVPFFFLGGDFLVAPFLVAPVFLTEVFLLLEGGLGMIDLEYRIVKAKIIPKAGC